MENLKVLVAMQLKEKLNLKGNKFSKKSTLFKTIFSILKFALIVALCYAVLFICNYINLFSLVKFIPSSVIAIVFSVMLLLQTLSVTWQLTKSLYFSKDNPILLVLPCKSTQIYLSKIIVFYTYELIKNFSFMIPLFTAYGIICKLPLLYYPWMLFCFIFIAMLPIMIGTILSIPTMWFYNFFRQYKRIQITSLVVLIGLVTYAIISIVRIIPSNIDLVATWGTTYWKIQDILNKFTISFEPLYKLVTMMVGKRIDLNNVLFTKETPIALLQLIALLVVLFGLGYVTSKPLFYKMASKSFEYSRNHKKEKENKKLNKTVSILKTEFLLDLRNSDRVVTNVTLMVSMPVLIFILNKIFAAMDTRLLGNNLTVTFNILIILLISLSSNCYAASVYSKQGKSSYLTKVQPSNVRPLLMAKLVFNSIFMVASFIATLIVLIDFSSLNATNAIYMILGCIFIYFAHLFFSAELDIMNPKVDLYSTISETGSNPNETKSTLIAFLVSFLAFGALLFLLIENSGAITYIKVMLIGLAFMLFRLYMLLSKIKLYYREKDL